MGYTWDEPQEAALEGPELKSEGESEGCVSGRITWRTQRRPPCPFPASSRAVSCALVVLSQSASAQGSEAREAVQEDTAATQAEVDSGAGEVPPSETRAHGLAGPNAEDDPAAATPGPSDPVDTVPPSPGDPEEASPVPSDVPEATPASDDTGSASPDVEPPIATSEGVSQGEPAVATGAPEAPAIAPPPVPAEPLAPAPSPSLKASQDVPRGASGAPWRAIPLVRLGTAEARSSTLPSVALLGSAPAERPRSGGMAVADEEPPPGLCSQAPTRVARPAHRMPWPVVARAPARVASRPASSSSSRHLRASAHCCSSVSWSPSALGGPRAS